jgi:hypothetical protein
MVRLRRGPLTEFILWGTMTLSTVQPADASFTRFIQQQRIEETTKASETVEIILGQSMCSLAMLKRAGAKNKN